MKIVGVTSCATGIAHTYIAKEKLDTAAKELGFEAKVEAQGSIGVDDLLTAEDIKQADVVIIAADVSIDKSRFEGKPIVNVPISMVMRSPKEFLKKVASKLEEGKS